MNLRHRLKQVFSGSFIRDVAKLSLGTLAGRLLTVAALPLLTRLYSPEDFALLASYVAIVSTIAVAACLRFEIAIPLADTDDDAKHLLVLALLALAAVTLVALLVVLAWPQQLTTSTGQPALQAYGWLIPVGIAALGLYSVMQYWATRARRFTQIAQTRISQAVVGVVTSVSMGWAGIAPLGLLLGNLLNTSAGSLRLARWSIKNDAHLFKGLGLRGLKSTLHQYKRYPIYSTPESFFNTAGVQVPVILVAAYAGEEAGFLMLAIQIMAAPMGLLGNSISQVYVSRAQQALHQGGVSTFTGTIMLRLFKVGLMPFLTLGIVSPWLVPYIFGMNWLRTGEIISWLTPWMLLQFVVSPVSMSLHVAGYQIYAMWLQVFGLIIRAGAVLLAAEFYPARIAEAFAASSAVFYFIYWVVVFKVTRSLRCPVE
jgi:O-antigen/teichoic acid export membrane protein